MYLLLWKFQSIIFSIDCFIGEKMTLDLNAFAVFARVVETGNFTAAAESMHFSKSMVSRQVAALEEGLGVRLLNRTTRRVSVTEAGAVVYERAQRIVAEAADAEACVTHVQGAVQGRLRVNAPMTFGIRQLSHVIPEFLERYPDLTVDLALNDRRVDLIEEGFDVSLRVSELEDSSLIARQLAPVRRMLVAAPAYFEKHGRPQTPEELKRHRFMFYSIQPRPEVIRLRSPSGRRIEVEREGQLYCNNADAMVPMLKAGGAIGFFPDFIVWKELRDGTLEAVMPDWEDEPLRLHAIYPHTHLLAPKVRAFVDFAVEKFGSGVAPWEHL